MQQLRVQFVAGAGPGQQWCEVCGEAKQAAVWLTPWPRPPGGAEPSNDQIRPLCTGCAEGLVEGALVTEAEIEQRRQKRRGSQEP